jgi:hypothetical protein
MRIFEDRTNAVIRPTDNQKKVLTQIKAAPTPQVAAAEISKGTNLLAARDMLIRLGLVELRDNEAYITPAGEEIMRNQNLADESGNLTPEGEKYAYDEKLKTKTSQTQEPGPNVQETLLQSIHRSL